MGLFRVSGSLTCVCDHSYACVYTHRGWTNWQRVSTFLTLKNSHKLFLCSWLCSNSGHIIHWILSLTLYQSIPVEPPHNALYWNVLYCIVLYCIVLRSRWALSSLTVVQLPAWPWWPSPVASVHARSRSTEQRSGQRHLFISWERKTKCKTNKNKKPT